MKHYVYKMTNELNGWIYIGQHYQTEVDPLEDKYVGSGSYWKREVLSKNLPIKKEIMHWNDALKCWDRYWVYYH